MLQYKEGFNDSLSIEGDDNITNEDEFSAIVEQCTDLQATVFRLLQNDYLRKFDNIASSLQKLEIILIKNLYPNKRRQFFISLFEAIQFPSFVLQILSTDDPNLNIIAYRFLDILCYLSDLSLYTFLFENSILDFCFSHLENNTEFDYHLIFSIGSLIQHSSPEILEYILSNIPFQNIFENPNNLQVNFLKSIVYLYKNIIKFTQTIPYPDQLIQYLQTILNRPQSDKITLYNILDFYIEIAKLAELNIKTPTSPNFVEIIQPFIQNSNLYQPLIQKVFASNPISDYHFLMIKLYEIYCKISKYLLHLCKNEDSSPIARQLLDTLYEPENIHFENLQKMLNITNQTNLSKEESELSSDIRQILVFLKIFIKTNPHIMIEESFYNVYEIIFSIIENFQYACKNSAFDLLVALIKRETPDNCSQILNQFDMYEAITENLLTDSDENIQAGLDLIKILVQKFLDEGREVLLRFNTEEFFSILDDIEERSSEDYIVEYCRQIREDLQASSEE